MTIVVVIRIIVSIIIPIIILTALSLLPGGRMPSVLRKELVIHQVTIGQEPIAQPWKALSSTDSKPGELLVAGRG